MAGENELSLLLCLPHLCDNLQHHRVITRFSSGWSIIRGVAGERWLLCTQTIVVVNADGQRAEENITVPKIHSALPSVADGMQILNIAGEDVLRGANVSITNAGGVSVKSVTQDQGDPKKLTAVLDGKLPGTYNVTVTNPDNQYAIWKLK